MECPMAKRIVKLESMVGVDSGDEPIVGSNPYYVNCDKLAGEYREQREYLIHRLEAKKDIIRKKVSEQFLEKYKDEIEDECNMVASRMIDEVDQQLESLTQQYEQAMDRARNKAYRRRQDTQSTI